MLIMKTEYKIFVSLLLIKFVTEECQACFVYNQNQNITIKSGSPFYQECQCSEPGQSVKNIKWLDTHNQEIGELGPGTKLTVYTETRDHTVSLQIPHMSKTLSGAYKCITIYNGLQYSLTYNVGAYDPVYFVNTEEYQYIINGTDSLIKCEARGESDPFITWHKDQDEPIENTSDGKYEITSKGLIVKSVTEDDYGTYRCTVSVFETGEEVDKSIKVEVVTIPTIEEIKFVPENTVVVGDVLTIECVADGIPHPEYIWRKTSETKSGNASWHQNTNMIIFDNIKTDDRGTYECIASNIAGKATKNFTVEVSVPPRITEFNDITAAEGSAAHIICKATGRPRPKIFLIIEEEYENEDSSMIFDTRKVGDTEIIYNLTLLTVNRSHEGVYVCNASNEVDFVTENMHMSVLYKPYFKNPMEIVWGWNGKTVNLSCEHESNPPAQLTWRYQGNEIPTEEQVTINRFITTVLENNTDLYIPLNINKTSLYGVYECTATNDFGETKKMITLKEGFIPPPVQNVTIVDVTATSVTFTIEGPEKVDGPPVLGFTSEYDEAENYNITNIHRNRTWSIDRPYKLEKLKPMTAYYIKFAAVNEVGIGSWSETIAFSTPEKSVPEPPTWDEDLNVMQTGSESSQLLRWKAPEHNGDPIDYYVIRYCPMENGEVQEEMCKQEQIAPTTELPLNQLEYNTTYYLELLAHNSEGNSTTASIYITTPEKKKKEEEQPILTAGAIIGIAMVVVLLILLVLDLLLLWWKQQGIIASCLYKKNKKRKQDSMLTRDKKGLLKDNGESTTEDTLKRPNNTKPKEYEYNKNTGIITGKHSAV